MFNENDGININNDKTVKNPAPELIPITLGAARGLSRIL
jgi:hypothetical protein